MYLIFLFNKIYNMNYSTFVVVFNILIFIKVYNYYVYDHFVNNDQITRKSTNYFRHLNRSPWGHQKILTMDEFCPQQRLLGMWVSQVAL